MTKLPRRPVIVWKASSLLPFSLSTTFFNTLQTMPTPVAKIPEPPTPRETMAAERKKGEQVFDVRRMTFAMGGGEKG